MSFVDRYWEWRRRCALEAPLGGQERTRELALVGEVLMERRSLPRNPKTREHRTPIDQVPAASVRAGHGWLRTTRDSSRTFEQDRSDEPPWRLTERREQPGANGSGYSTILVAIDGLGFSAEVGKEAVKLARSLPAALVVLSFINVRRASRMGIYRSLALAELERDSGIVARQTKELADESGVECEVWSAWDPLPARAIVGAAREVEADCIVLGSPGASVVERLLARAIGGAHDKVLRQARCPVLSVRPGTGTGVPEVRSPRR